jgi:HNH endonuclease
MMDRAVPVTESGCWIYIGSIDGGGYGTVSTSRGQAPAKAHRLAYEEKHGPVPDGMDVCHKCDTPPCVNGDHLFAGSRLDNMRDCVAKGRQARGEYLKTKRAEAAERKNNARS